MNDEFKIQLRIAGKTYPFNCKRTREDEKLARRAAEQINEQMVRYQQFFAAELEPKDLLAMVAFQLSLSDAKKVEDQDVSLLFDRLKELSQSLEEYLGSQD